MNVSRATSNADCQLTVDKRLIEQVLINLISNAVKFSSVGGEVKIDLADDSEEFVDICISDQGGGIDPKILDRIGEPFLVGSAQISADGQGAGLGLSISKKIMEAMGGELIIESRLKQGVDARMRFPKTETL
ncbi:MAG: ATP-binding protein [Rhodospirillaceae bacterium]|jgi:signal transduction histidine kinase|nr:ATP-binding protein [Rhodospirillaceae bacterium]MBT5241483.1 ATP-binding protein [Rhodospirillaceae bacterium]MBT5566247.1 ATP-binding protein [Rhodospirillaceae bacterium]MBT6088965.1 ATP-binding protein [Rhodospirillaceae bacterium]MBT6961879.1 ATP-binding protein [Rhodospirillaceae bacterium]